MIAKLTGILDRAGRDHAVIDVGGVGYLVRCSSRTLAGLSGAGAPVSLAIVTMVREDAIELYGFAEETERDWFRLLLTVQGVGAKVAMALLSALAPDQLANALASGDKAAAEAALKAAEPELMRGAQKGVVHKNAAARKVSRLAKRVKAIK